MAKTRKITAAYFSKWRAVYWLIVLCIALFFAFKLPYDAYYYGKRVDKIYLFPPLIFSIYWASQWNAHLIRVIRNKNPHIRIEGDNIIAFGKVFPKGPNDYILFEKLGGNKLGYWVTLRNGNDEMVIPLIPKRRYEEYEEPVISNIIT